MTGWDLQSLCRRMVGYRKVSLATYLVSNDKPFYEMLAEYFLRTRQLKDSDITDFVKANYNYSQTTFSPFDLMNDASWNNYLDWKKKYRTNNLYFDTIKNSFTFIENFCINNNLNLADYYIKHGEKHIRERIIDWSVAVHLQIINPQIISTPRKILLKDYLKQYRIIKQRLMTNSELQLLMEEETERVKQTIDTFRQKYQSL
jgi:hypothetical protein